MKLLKRDLNNYLPILNFINLRFSNVDFKHLWIIRVKDVFNRAFDGNNECSSIFVKLDIGWSHNFNIFFEIFNSNDSGSVKTNFAAEHHTPDVNTTLLRFS